MVTKRQSSAHRFKSSQASRDPDKKLSDRDKKTEVQNISRSIGGGVNTELQNTSRSTGDGVVIYKYSDREILVSYRGN
jgi:hypothetical protein